jgi:hypothetical protein
MNSERGRRWLPVASTTASASAASDAATAIPAAAELDAEALLSATGSSEKRAGPAGELQPRSTSRQIGVA